MFIVELVFKRKNKGGKDSISNSTLRSLRDTIKGYSRYDVKADRKNTDEALRTYLHAGITELYDEFSQVANQLMRSQILSAWQAGNLILKELQGLRGFLVADVYRHSTFFDAIDVSSIIEISVIYIIESEIILTIDACKILARKINEEIANVMLENVEKDVMALKKNIDGFSRAIRDRAELIASFELVGF